MRAAHNKTAPRLTAVITTVITVLALAAAPVLAQVNGSIALNNDRRQGTHPSGGVLLFTPDPVQPGSSISHWDTSPTPNLLMEPFITPDLPFLGLDATPAAMEDEGWPLGTANFVVTPLNTPGSGFTDPRPFDGAPGNDATTLGEARMNLVNAVLAAWAGTLESSVDIDVLVDWQPAPCGAGGAALAFAGPVFVFRDDTGILPLADTWYHAALAEALAGGDATGPPDQGGGDIIVVINSDIDNECAGPGTGFYYGLDGNDPDNLVDLAPVVLHELGHGLGFSNFTDETTGVFFGSDQNGRFPGIFDHFTFDHTLGRTWAEMTAAERVVSAVNFRQVSWSGARATEEGEKLLDTGVAELVVSSPASVAGTYEVGTAQFGPPVDAPVTGEIFCMEDETVPSPFDGCSPATNPDQIAGKIALIDRGTCVFTDKVRNAEAAGAIAAIIVNDQGNDAPGLGGDDTLPINIPAVSLGRRDGQLIRQAACGERGVFLNGGRFRAEASWTDFDGNTGMAEGRSLSDSTGAFYFFNEDNIELVVKVLDACDIEGFNSFWVFAAGLTNVEVELTVTDTQTGEINTYFNPLRNAFESIQDTQAFLTCP